MHKIQYSEQNPIAHYIYDLAVKKPRVFSTGGRRSQGYLSSSSKKHRSLHGRQSSISRLYRICTLASIHCTLWYYLEFCRRQLFSLDTN